jgi:hypothetical protein
MLDTRKFHAFRRYAEGELGIRKNVKLLAVLHEADSTLSSTSFVRMNNGSASDEVIARFNAAIDKIAKAKGFHLKAHDIEAAIAPPTQARRRRDNFVLPGDGYEGVWLAVHFSTIRAAKRKERRPPRTRYRTALLVYGPDSHRGREYTMYGYSAIFDGTVTFNKDRLYYQADELKDGLERAYIITKEAFVGEDKAAEHFGIMLGIGRGDQDSDGPIYASKIFLRKISDVLRPKEVREIVEHDEKRRLWCRYVYEEQIGSPRNRIERTIFRAVKSLRHSVASPSNAFSFGDRLFLK